MDCSRARTRDPVEWLQTCPDFSAPLAEQVHEWILTWEPDLTEAIKWNVLCFTGRKLVCGLSACRRHLAVTFFRGVELSDPARLLTPNPRNTAILSLRITDLARLDRRAFRELVHEAAALDAEPPAPRPIAPRRPPPAIPSVLAREFRRAPTAARFFRSLAPTYQREYINWVTQARRPETLARRLAETLAALRTGKKWGERRPHRNTR